ncbi:MAG: 4-alpha-glucanotransferase [Chthoniobacterales bacterium]
MQLSYEEKIAGVLVPLFALRREGDLGIGDLAALCEFIDWSREIGFRVVQLLPINEVGGDNSPYNAISSVAVEPTTLTLAPGTPSHLTDEDFARITSTFDLTALRSGAVKYDAVKRIKRALLEAAFANFSGDLQFDAFCEREAMWLRDYVFFRALMERNGESEMWDQWPAEHRSQAAARLWRDSLGQDERAQFERREKFFAYVQWIATQQWREINAFATSRGVSLMGDIPFGVSYYSADAWARPDEFQLGWSGGAPPEPYFKDDEFTMKWGQNWGIPVYDWHQMRSRNFQWWRQRVQGVARFFHAFRIDHVLGFYRIYAFPWRPARNAEFLPLNQDEMLNKTGGRAPHFAPRDDETSENREANQREGEEYLRVVLEESDDTRVVGEDLGTVPPYVRPSLKSLNIAGFKIPQWECYHGRVTPGTEYERISVATYATHDHKPLRAMWEEAFERKSDASEQARGDLEKIATFAAMEPRQGPINYGSDFYPRIMEALFASNSWLAIVMITDLLARKDRFNVPGMADEGNWTRRMHATVSELRQSRTTRERMRLIRELLRKTARLKD